MKLSDEVRQHGSGMSPYRAWADRIAELESPWIAVSERLPEKDGTTFLSLNKRQGGLYCVVWWASVHKRWVGTGGQAYYQFTHWMPISPPEDV